MEEISKIKKIRNLFGVIVIGAVGSGVWDLFLKNLVYQIGNLFVWCVLYFNHGYLDRIYSHVGKGIEIEILPAISLIVLIMSLPFLFIIRINYFFKHLNRPNIARPSKYQQLSNYIFESKRRIYILILLLTIPLTLMYGDLLIRTLSVKKANSYIERNIEIVRPYIGESDYYILRSKFRQIDNKQKLQEMLDVIKEIEIKNKISIQPTNLYGIND